MKSLFTVRPDEDLDEESIEQFCKLGIRETTRVEYKQEFPRDLAKSIASFANTQGGIILIGVVGDSNNRPVLPLTGMPFVQEMEERVYQTCANAIYPPLFPSAWVVRFDEPSLIPTDRAIVVIRIEQGETAHAVDGRKGIYLRSGNVSTPIEMATLEEVTEILGRRKESLEVRSALILQSRQRFAFFFDQYLLDIRGKVSAGLLPFAEGLLRKAPIVRIQMVPTFPNKPLMGLRELRKILRSVQAWRVESDAWMQFPPNRTERTAQDAIIRVGGNRFLEVAECSEYGLWSFSYIEPQDARCALTEPLMAATGIDYWTLVHTSLAMLTFGILAYQAIGFYGSCDFNFEINGARGRKLALQRYEFDEPCPDEKIVFFTRSTPGELKNSLQELFIRLMNKIENAFGRETNDERAEELVRLAAQSIGMNFGKK